MNACGATPPASSPSLHYLLTGLFETMTLWDVKTQSATTRRLPDGKYEVTLEVTAQKLRANSTGVDPNRTLIERERSDNVVDVETGG